MALLAGWPDLVFPVFKIIEPRLKKGAAILIDDVEGFTPAMQGYPDNVSNPSSGYISATLRWGKGIEFTVKMD